MFPLPKTPTTTNDTCWHFLRLDVEISSLGPRPFGAKVHPKDTLTSHKILLARAGARATADYVLQLFRRRPALLLQRVGGEQHGGLSCVHWFRFVSLTRPPSLAAPSAAVAFAPFLLLFGHETGEGNGHVPVLVALRRGLLVVIVLVPRSNCSNRVTRTSARELLWNIRVHFC